MATTIGTAWINIKPSLNGVQSAIQKQLKGTGSAVGNDLTDEMTKSVTKGTAIGTALGNVIYDGVKKAMSAVQELIGDAFNYSNKLAASTKVLQSMGNATEDVEKATKKLQKTLKRLPTSTASALKGVQQLAASWGDLDFSTDAFMAFNSAILYGGGTVENLENAITQLSQVALDGPLDAQTWLSLRNSGLLPAAQAVAELNGMTVNELKESLGKGNMTTREFLNSLIQIENQTGKFSKGAEAANQTISGSFQVLYKNVTERLGGIIDKLGLQSGLTGAIQNLGVKIEEFLGGAEKFIDWLETGGEDAETFKNAIEVIGATIGGIGVGNLLVQLPKFAPVLAKIGSAIAGILNPIALLVGAIAGMGVAIYNFRDEIKDFLLNGLPNWFNNTFNGISQWGADVGNAIGQFGYDVTEKFRRAGAEVQMMGNDIKNFFSGIGQWFSDRFTEARNGVTAAFQNIGTWFGERWNDIKNAFAAVGTWFRDRFNDAKNGISSSFGKIGDWFKERWNDIKNAFAGVRDLGKNIIEGLWNGINDMVGWIKSKIQGFGDSVLQALKDFFGIKSPSRVMRDEVGKFISMGLADGILKGEDAVTSAMNQLGNDALAQMAGIDSELSQGISTAVTANATLANEDESTARVVQNNVFNVNDNFDLLRISSDLGYAVAMA